MFKESLEKLKAAAGELKRSERILSEASGNSGEFFHEKVEEEDRETVLSMIRDGVDKASAEFNKAKEQAERDIEKIEFWAFRILPRCRLDKVLKEMDKDRQKNK